MKRIAIGAAGLFVLLGLILAPYAGLEADEVVFAKPYYAILSTEYCLRIFHHYVPLMVFPYAGSLKTLLFWPVLRAFGPNVWSIRVSAILLGGDGFPVLFAVQAFGWFLRSNCGLLIAGDRSFVSADQHL